MIWMISSYKSSVNDQWDFSNKNIVWMHCTKLCVNIIRINHPEATLQVLIHIFDSLKVCLYKPMFCAFYNQWQLIEINQDLLYFRAFEEEYGCNLSLKDLICRKL